MNGAPDQALLGTARWELASEWLLRSYTVGTIPDGGKRTRLCYRILQAIGFSDFLVLWFLRLSGLVHLAELWFSNDGDKVSNRPARAYFIGFGSGGEENLKRRFDEEYPDGCHLDQTRPGMFRKHSNVRFMQIASKIMHESRAALDRIDSVQDPWVEDHRLQFLAHIATRLGLYAFHFSCWMRISRDAPSPTIVFIAADTPSFGCIDAAPGRVEFWQHGLLRKSVMVPRFDSMKLLTTDEQRYFQDLLPGIQASVVPSQQRLTTHSNTLLITSCYETPEFSKLSYVETLDDVIDWAARTGLSIKIRLHPVETDAFWEERFPALEVLDASATLEQTILDLQPKFLLTWFSTTLLEAASCNIIPVSISPEQDTNLNDLIVNIRDHCLNWETEFSQIDALARGETDYNAVSQRLLEGKHRSGS